MHTDPGSRMERGLGHPSVCVYLASSNDIPERYFDLADEAGRAIAGRGWTLVTGGGSVGMMGVIARACRDAGGRTIGVIPQALIDMEVADHDADELVVVDTMRQRKAIMEDRASAFLALPGGLGTLEELMEVWTSRTLGMHGKPVVVCDPWGDYDLLRAQVWAWQEQGLVRSSAAAQVSWVKSVEEALDVIAAHDRMRP
jgi:uncharacterized protein (TIGR00730 family)